MVDKDYKKGSKTAIVSYGITSRCAKSAVKILRKKGKKTDYLRLISIWPFPRKEIETLAKKVNRIYVPEMNLGQIYHTVMQYSYGKCDVISIPKTGGEMHSPGEIVDAVIGGA